MKNMIITTELNKLEYDCVIYNLSKDTIKTHIKFSILQKAYLFNAKKAILCLRIAFF